MVPVGLKGYAQGVAGFGGRGVGAAHFGDAASLEAGEHLMAPARALLDAAGLSYDTEVGVGDPAHTLVDIIESTGCTLAIVGARGEGALRSALLGSVSQELVHASPVPVTVVKHAEALEEGEEGEEDAEPST